METSPETDQRHRGRMVRERGWLRYQRGHPWEPSCSSLRISSHNDVAELSKERDRLMGDAFNLYCDESCHLENDHQGVMVLGAIRCRQSMVPQVSEKIRQIKARHGIPEYQEVKWTKVTPKKLGLYLDLIDAFFDDENLGFRAVVIDKDRLQHSEFGQTHDTFYYKMYYRLIEQILRPDSEYFVYLDIKDTLGSKKVQGLHKYLCNGHYDFNQQIVRRIQLVRSHEVQLLQLADVMIGALAYFHRNLDSSPAKLAILQRIRERSGYRLICSTLPGEQKFNLFLWKGKDRC